MLVAAGPSFGERLKNLRETAGVSQYALAKKSGVTAQAISKIEQGDRDPSWSTVVKLAHALGISVADFDATAEGDDEPPATSTMKPAPKKPKH